MTIKYDVLYTNGKVESFTKGALNIEQVQNKAIYLSRMEGVLKVTYTIQEEVVNLGELENLYEKVIQCTDISSHHELLDPATLRYVNKKLRSNDTI